MMMAMATVGMTSRCILAVRWRQGLVAAAASATAVCVGVERATWMGY